MALSRRRFLGSGAAATTAAVVATTTHATLGKPSAALAACSVAGGPLTGSLLPGAVQAPLEVIALSRAAFGPRPGDLDAFQSGLASPEAQFESYVEQQLNPAAINDSDCDSRIAATRLKIKYDTMNEARPLVNLNKSLAELWELNKDNPMMPNNYQERRQPFNEVQVATWIRAVYSKRQLLEVMADFWHNHFNVNGTSDQRIMSTWPVYDRDVIRKNAFGNFRTFVEDVGKSVAMMHYLDNVSNRAAGGEGGNENYARELFELHTLGSDNYLKFYDDRRNIGVVEYNGEQFARGYIDEDVYEAARCFSGWTIANGDWRSNDNNDGSFYYNFDWHDTNPKTVLAPDGFTNIPRNQAELKDGRDVYDLLTNHPGTARHLCTKLCRRLVADEPPASVVDAAIATWMANRAAPNQIALVIRTILLSDVFKTTWGQKMKRPLEAMWAYLRGTNAELPIDVVAEDGNTNKGGYWGSLFWNVDQTGQRLFQWGPPTGHPDLATYWASTNGMLQRWNLPYNVTQPWGGNVGIDIVGQTNLNDSCVAIVDFWIDRLCGYAIREAVRNELAAFMAQGGDPNEAPKPTEKAPDWGKPEALEDRVRSMVQLLVASPDFHLR